MNGNRDKIFDSTAFRKALADSTQPYARLSIRVRFLHLAVILLAATAIALPILSRSRAQGPPAQSHAKKERLRNFDAQIVSNANELLEDGRQVFRFNTFGDEKFWGDTLQLHKAIEGANLGGVGQGISPNTALNLGLKVDIDALPQPLIEGTCTRQARSESTVFKLIVHLIMSTRR